MSSLLEQAIIDAKTLKETALRNAEERILEQYSEEIKQTMQALLEQDETVGDLSGADLGATVAPETSAVSETTKKATQSAVKNTMNKIDAAYLNEDGLQEIEINLDSLVEKVSKIQNDMDSILPAMQFSNEPVVPQTVSRMPQDVTPLAETFELDEDLLNEQPEETKVDPKFDQDVARKEGDLARAKAARSEAAAKLAADEKTKRESEQRAALKTETLAEDAYALDEEIMMDMAKFVKPGGINAHETEVMIQKAIKKALDAQKEDLLATIEKNKAEKKKLEETLETVFAQLQETKDKFYQSLELNKQLKEGVEYLSEKFNLVNLLNAKLLYTNKTLGNSSLNERQKSQIAESISSASSVEEAKTIYETLQKSASVVVEKRNPPKSLTEALSKAPSPFLPRKQAQNDSTADRWKLLAGIRK